MTYHFLPEAETFSEFKGGAISRWAAKVLRDEPNTIIVCSSADDTWGFAPERVHLAPAIRTYLKFRGRRHYPPQLSGSLLRHFYGRDLPTFQPGDVIWVHGVPAIAEALLSAAKRAGARVVFHLHSSAFATDSRPVMVRLKRHADLIVFCSDFLGREARSRFPDLTRTAVLYNGADETMFYPATPREHQGMPVVLFASRLVPQKGAHVLIEAMRSLERDSIELQAKIFGASAFGGSAVSSYIRSLQKDLPSNVELCGYQSGHSLAQQFREADIFCLPATYEDPFPLAILEAMASQLAIVASHAGGIPEALADGAGKLVQPNDSRALATALTELATQHDLRTQMAAQAFSTFRRRFSWEIVQAGYRRLLATL
jgi:spore coat protein SA